MTSTGVDVFFPTHSGKRITLPNPDPSQIRIEDIALGLASNPRWGGQTDPDRNPISGAEHSVRMSHLVPVRVALLALLHDAPEYVMCDMPRPVKESMPGYKEREDDLLFVILKKFGIQNQLYTPEASWMWDLDKVFPLVEIRFSGLFASRDNHARMNGETDLRTNQWVNLLGVQTVEDFPDWGWPRRTAYDRFLARSKQLGVLLG